MPSKVDKQQGRAVVILAMAVQRRRNKSGTYRYRAYWRNPFTQKVEYGHWTSEGKARKESDHVAYRLKHERESFRPGNQPASSEGLYLLDLLATYHASAEMTDSTHKATFYHLKAVAAHRPFQALLVKDLTPALLREFERALRATGLKQNGVNRKVGIITAALAWAHDQRLIESVPINPAEYRCKRGPDKRTPPLTPSEVEELCAAAPPHIVRAIFLAYLTGARVGPSELLGIKWADFFFDEGFIRVRAAKKNDEIQWRDVPVADEAAWSAFRDWYAQDRAKGIPYVIHWGGKPIKTLKTAWKATFRRANEAREEAQLPPIEYRKPYSVRHSFVTFLLAQGADLKTTSRLAGHSDISTTTRIYQHEVESLRRDAAERLPKIKVASSQGENADGIHLGIQKRGKEGFFCMPPDDKVQ